jgi:hypothetical protein
MSNPSVRHDPENVRTDDHPAAPRASEPIELWWTSHDGSGEMPMGEYASEADALAAISAARHELLAECGTEQQRRDILAGRWTVVRPTPEE